jgi:hypothetical protein
MTRTDSVEYFSSDDAKGPRLLETLAVVPWEHQRRVFCARVARFFIPPSSPLARKKIQGWSEYFACRPAEAVAMHPMWLAASALQPFRHIRSYFFYFVSGQSALASCLKDGWMDWGGGEADDGLRHVTFLSGEGGGKGRTPPVLQGYAMQQQCRNAFPVTLILLLDLTPISGVVGPISNPPPL